MDTRRLVAGTLVGGIILYAVGYLIFNVAFAAFYAANAGSATGVDRASPLVWAGVLASLSYAALVTLAIANRAGSPTIGAGVMIGAVVGFLVWFTADFAIYDFMNVQNLTRTVVDPLLEAVHGGIGGGVIAVVLAKIPASGRREDHPK
jgi:hypothetical protein